MQARIESPVMTFPGAATTRLADRADPVPDEVWEEAACPQLGALVISIATINAFNRVNAATRQISGDWVEQVIERDLWPA